MLNRTRLLLSVCGTAGITVSRCKRYDTAGRKISVLTAAAIAAIRKFSSRLIKAETQLL